MKKQTQKAGDESVNVQAESITINTGLSVSDAREIAIGVFRENFLELRDEAADVAFERARVFTDDLVEKLAAEPGLLDAARDPDYQYGLFTAQREYARTGDDDLGATLTDLLVRRAGHNERTLLQVALNEAIPTVGKLTSDQFSILSVLFLVRYTHWGAIVDFAALASMLDESIGPFIDDLPPTLASLQHLEYAGCGSIGIGEIRIEEAFSKAYPGTFSKGLTVEQKDEFIASQPDDSLPPDLFIPHHTEPELFRFLKSLKNSVSRGKLRVWPSPPARRSPSG